MSDPSMEADRMIRMHIRRFAYYLREFFGIENEAFVDVINFAEIELTERMPGFILDVLPTEIMGNTHGFAKPDLQYVGIREDVYFGASDGNGRDRGTVMHELGHIFLHTSNRMSYPSTDGKIAAYKHPEWQAKAFAGEFLVSAHLVDRYKSVSEVANAFGVSTQSARYQLGTYVKEGLIQRGQITDLSPK